MRRAGRAGPAVALVLCFGGLACGRGEPPAPSAGSVAPVRVEDSDRRTVELAEPARRIVSLVPSATLTLDAIGARAAVVARTDFDTASWTRGLPSVGGGLQPRLEAILAVDPDLVVRFGGSQDPETPARLDELGIPHVAIRPDRIEDVFTVARVLGTLTGRKDRADSLVASLRAGLEAVRAEAAGRGELRVAYVLGGSPPWVAGPGTYIDELIRLAGGVNAFGDLASLYAAVSPEQFLARDIDVILRPAGSALEGRLSRDAIVAGTTDALELPGPAVADAAREVARILERAASR